MTAEAPPQSRWKGFLVPGIPFLLSLGLSLSTVGSQVYWQDSGLYLVGVKEMGLLYPPGFVLYQLLCKAWTLLLFFVDFTLAVHLLSVVLGASAAATLAVAARDLLRTRGPLFRVTPEDPGPLADASGMVAGCLAACGYTFWFTSIYAKGYTLYYFVLALLLWRMIRADETGKGRDFTLVAALIGAAWQAHPSAALLGLAFLAFVLAHRKTLGAKGIAGRTGVAAACALGLPLIAVPLLTARESLYSMADPKGLWEILRYLSGRRFIAMDDVFGVEPSRVSSFGQFLWEEMLGIGLILVTVGLATLAKANRKLLAGLAAWMIPCAVVTILFKIEGQHDCWFVGAWMPLYLAAGIGAWVLARAAGPRASVALAGIATIAVAWAALTNWSFLNLRRYDLAQRYGEVYLRNLDRDAVLVLETDDPLAIVGFQVRVQKARPDVTYVRGPFLALSQGEDRDWYDDRLLREYPFLRRPAYGDAFVRFPPGRWHLNHVSLAAFLNANAECGRPLFCQHRPPPVMIRQDYVLVPAGALWKLVPRTAEQVDLRYWQFPIQPEDLGSRFGRERGQKIQVTPDALIVSPESYEQRLVRTLLTARRSLAVWLAVNRKYAQALPVFESILRLDPEPLKDAEFVYPYALSLHGTGELSRAEPLLRRALESATQPQPQSQLLFCLATIQRARLRHDEAQQLYRSALAVPGLDEASRRSLEEEWQKR